MSLTINWKKAGFTLVEMMVVLGIIGIMTMVVVSSIGENKTRARDDKRVGDVKNIELAAEFYYLKTKTYPPSIATLISFATTNGGLKIGDYSTDILYIYNSANNTYRICAPLEVVGSRYLKENPNNDLSGESACTGSDTGEKFYYYVDSRY